MTRLSVILEDEWLVAIDKPSGLLSQPGLQVRDSVHVRLLEERQDLSGPVLVHRLDMDTSGVMLLAKTRRVHRHLQQQFEHRRVEKCYVALLNGPLPGLGGRIDLPLRLDIDNRPYQIVCRVHGKPSTTLWRVAASQEGEYRVLLYPQTGRTHQLRVHLGDARGLGVPIRGDRLYGVAGERLMLHAAQLSCMHPISGEPLHLVAPVPF